MMSSGLTLIASLSGNAVFGRARVRGQAFAVSELGSYFPELGRALPRNADEARALLEIVDAERRRESRAARGREHVVGTCAVIADRLRRVAADEDRAGMADFGEQRLGVFDGE